MTLTIAHFAEALAQPLNLNVAQTAWFRATGRRVNVYRRTRLRSLGTLSVDGELGLGAVWWPRTTLLHGYFWIDRGARVHVQGRFDFHTGLAVEVGKGATLVVGSGFANDSLRMICHSRISIGDNVMIGPSVTIRDSDDHALLGGSPSPAPITICDHVWLGERSMVLKGVTIGEGSVLAAGAVATKDIPARSLAAGIPAKVIRRDFEWDWHESGRP
jgi:acetyltransferase-like isoleucine patch superfamily enzyme